MGFLSFLKGLFTNSIDAVGTNFSTSEEKQTKVEDPIVTETVVDPIVVEESLKEEPKQIKEVKPKSKKKRYYKPKKKQEPKK